MEDYGDEAHNSLSISRDVRNGDPDADVVSIPPSVDALGRPTN